MLITSNIKVYTGIISQQCPHYIKNTNTQIKVIVDWTIEELNEGVEKVLQQPHNFHVTVVPISCRCPPPPVLLCTGSRIPAPAFAHISGNENYHKKMNFIIISKNYFRLRITKLQNYKNLLKKVFASFLYVYRNIFSFFCYDSRA